MNDPDIHAAIERAVRALAGRLAAVAPLADPEAAARAYLEELVAGPDRWRPIPPGPDWHEFRQRDPDTARRGAERARAALTRMQEEADHA